MKIAATIAILAALGLSLSACKWDHSPQACASVSEQKGASVARKSLKQFLHYTGKTHAPLSGPSGMLNPARLEHVNDGDLVFDGRDKITGVYNFHLGFFPKATFTATVAPDCSVNTGWNIG